MLSDHEGTHPGREFSCQSPNAAPRSPLHPWLAGVPIVDGGHGLIASGLFALINDTFFMSLMFLLSGLFVVCAEDDRRLVARNVDQFRRWTERRPAPSA